MVGGNFAKAGMTSMTGFLDKAKNMGRSKAKEVIRMNPTVGQIQDKLSKYM